MKCYSKSNSETEWKKSTLNITENYISIDSDSISPIFIYDYKIRTSFDKMIITGYIIDVKEHCYKRETFYFIFTESAITG